MARKDRKKGADPEEKRTAASYYKLNKKAVEDLVTADKENSPEVPEEELKKYRSRSKIHIPGWLGALLVKYWFNGAVCFFILWGLGGYIADQLDMMFVLGVVHGMVTDILVNNIFRHFEETPGSNDRWMMFPKKGYLTFFGNILYAFAILLCVFMTYNVINVVVLGITHAEGTIPVGVEPFLYGLIYLAFDMLFIGMKHLLKRVIADARQKTGSPKGGK